MQRRFDFRRFYTLSYNYIAWNETEPALPGQARPPGPGDVHRRRRRSSTTSITAPRAP